MVDDMHWNILLMAVEIWHTLVFLSMPWDLSKLDRVLHYAKDQSQYDLPVERLWFVLIVP
jgi:hypothetical protein